MARGTTLANLRSWLKAEIGEFSGTNTARDSALNILLSNKQKWLATEYEWPFLDHFVDSNLAIGGQYNAFPTVDIRGTNIVALNLERMPTVSVFFNSQYLPVDYGIGDEQYNFQNFALGQSNDPVRRWRWATNPNETQNPNQFEVWPVPASPQVLRFFGQRAMYTLASDSDTADLDDMLLVKWVAGDLLTRNKQADAQLKLQEAAARLKWVRQNYPTTDKKRILGSDGAQKGWRTDIKLVAIAHS